MKRLVIPKVPVLSGPHKVSLKKSVNQQKIVSGLKQAISVAKGEKPPARITVFHKPRPTAAEMQKAIDVRLAARQRYRDKNNVTLDTCLGNLDDLESFAKVQAVTLPNGKTREWPVVSVTALGPPLNISGVSATRWVNSGMLPKPILKTGRGLCYHIDELRVFVTLIGAHQAELKQYRHAHIELKQKIFNEDARVRKSLFV